MVPPVASTRTCGNSGWDWALAIPTNATRFSRTANTPEIFGDLFSMSGRSGQVPASITFRCLRVKSGASKPLVVFRLGGSQSFEKPFEQRPDSTADEKPLDGAYDVGDHNCQSDQTGWIPAGTVERRKQQDRDQHRRRVE